MKLWQPTLKPRSFANIHCTKVNGDLAEVVQCNRGALSSFVAKPFSLTPVAAGVTLGSSAIRRRPNAFNLLHQLEVMLRGGYAADSSLEKLQAIPTILFKLCHMFSMKFSTFINLSFHHLPACALHVCMEALENVAACAAAYQVGRTEAGAATNLFKSVSTETKEQLKELVRPGVQHCNTN